MSPFFKRRVNIEKVRDFLKINAEQVYYETKSYDQFKYELTLRVVEAIMWNEYELGWENLPEEEEIEFVTEVSNILEKDIKALFNHYKNNTNLQESIRRILREETEPKKKLYYEFKCTDADEDGIFYDTPFGEIDSTEFTQFIDDMESYPISQDKFEKKFKLSPEIIDIIDNSKGWEEFYDKSDEDGFVVIFDGDVHYIYSV